MVFFMYAMKRWTTTIGYWDRIGKNSNLPIYAQKNTQAAGKNMTICRLKSGSFYDIIR